jgi:inner membrane protein
VATLGHLAVGLLAGRAQPARSPRARAAVMAGFAGLAVLPDLDVLGVAVGLPDHTSLGHRGFTHSLLFAALVAAAVGLGARRFGARPILTGLLAFLAIASHGVLDAMTYTTRGVPFLWPFVDEAIVFPWRPIPAAPTDAAFFGLRGLQVIAIELVYFAPMLFAAWFPLSPKQVVAFGLRRAPARFAAVLALVGVSLTSAHTYLQHTRVVGWLEGLGDEELVMASAARGRREKSR